MDSNAVSSDAMNCLLFAEIVLVAVVLFILPLLFWLCGRKDPRHFRNARGLGLPRGSVRSMVALLIVGSTVNFLLFGAKAVGDTSFSEIMAALATLSGSVIGFYFGGRTAAPHPPDGPTPDSENRT